jgi:hypothetical protein
VSLWRSPWALAVQRVANLRPAPVGKAEARATRVGPDDTLGVDHDHPRAEVGTRLAGEPLQLGRSVQPARGACGDDEGLRRGVVLHLRLDPAREIERERNLERDDDQQQDVRERGKQSQSEAHDPSAAASSGAANRKPTPRTVCR